MQDVFESLIDLYSLLDEALDNTPNRVKYDEEMIKILHDELADKLGELHNCLVIYATENAIPIPNELNQGWVPDDRLDDDN